jgi:hypothetical protein
MLKFNNDLKLIISDVDETIADLFKDTDLKLVKRLEDIIRSGKILFLVSGGGIKRIEKDLVNLIDSSLRHKIIVSHCNSAQIFGYDEKGSRIPEPFYDLATGKLSKEEHLKWREILNEVINKFNLKTTDAMPVAKFKEMAGGDPHMIMYDDRDVQITLEIINAYDLKEADARSFGISEKRDGRYDLRFEIVDFANKLLIQNGLPVRAHIAGVFAVNFLLGTMTKGDSIKFLKKEKGFIEKYGLTSEIFEETNAIEIWGDKFSIKSGPNDWTMSVELNPDIRSITFRQENPEDLPKDYNVVVWDGEKHLHEGLLEFLEQ